MCGITGIINKKKEPIEPQLLKSINDLITHRGPDGEGYYYYKNIGLAHKRLSILDLSERGEQPMQYNENYIITYNGEVYNYVELRDILCKKGYKFTTHTDTEVILAAYQEWGKDCVNYFNGMWSFAIINKKENNVFISRDRFGIKPLYYLENESGFFFGSEIKQLLPQLKVNKVNKQRLFDYLYLGFHDHTNETFYKNIYSLEPGYNITYDLIKNTYKKTKYYTLKIKKDLQKLSFNQAQKQFEKTIDRAISLRLRSDVTVGTCLSGGLDSSYIASVAAKEYNAKNKKKFKAITAKSIEKKTDESFFAKIVAEKANLDWKIIEPQKEDFFAMVNDVIKAQEEPFGSPSIIMQYFVMKKAKKEGCKVMLDGQGGDESLLGYDRYYAAYLNQQKGIINKIKSYINISTNSGLSIYNLLLYNFYFNSSTIRAYRQKRRYKYIKKKYQTFLNKKFLVELAQSAKSIKNLQYKEITQVQLQKLLKYEDRNAMWHSIEARVPYVDYKVVEFAYSLPFSYKMYKGWTKYILRKSAKNKLSNDIIWRKNKFGFEAPTDTWLSDREYFLKIIKESIFLSNFIEFKKIPKNIDVISVWKLYNISIWAKIFNVEF